MLTGTARSVEFQIYCFTPSRFNDSHVTLLSHRLVKENARRLEAWKVVLDAILSNIRGIGREVVTLNHKQTRLQVT